MTTAPPSRDLGRDDLLEVHDVHSHYGDSHILRGVSLSVPRGRCVAVMGRNGAGKTTLAHAIVGFHPPTAGSVRFQGRDVTGWTPDRIVRGGIALVPQGRRIFPSLSVAEHLDLPTRRRTRTAVAWDLDTILDLFPVLRERARQNAATLSGGEQQMLAIARALSTGPELLVMDEPSEGLAPLVLGHLREVLANLRDFDLSMLLVEQNVQLGLEMADHVYILNKGEVVHSSSPEALRHDEHTKSVFLGLGG